MRSKVQPKTPFRCKCWSPKTQAFSATKKPKPKKLGKQIQHVHSTSLGTFGVSILAMFDGVSWEVSEACTGNCVHTNWWFQPL